mgnify:CR=1 FL=1
MSAAKDTAGPVSPAAHYSSIALDALQERVAKLEAEKAQLVEALGALLSLPVARDELRFLDRGIGTATPNAAWLKARAALAAVQSREAANG